MSKARPTPVRKPPAAKRPARRKSELPTIVAVGASAGGLEAFSELLAALPRDAATLNMAFVFLQHLQPGHRSLLAELLQKSTFLRVQDASDGVVPQPGNVYVLPASKEMQLRDGKLRLRNRQADLSLPVDIFMRSLAEERKGASIGVVLAGTASDGTLGLEAIKAEGGICFAQAEDTTEFSGMIRSAIASGCVDFVFPPAEIARELARIGRHPYLAPGPEEQRAAALGLAAGNHRAYAGILDLIRRDTGMDFSEYRTSTIGRRIARRMALHTLERPEDYLRYLREHPHEVAQLGEDILIPATRFFRDAEVFEALKTKVLLPLIRQHKTASQPIRLWSVGCATGEEAYSLAMIALECLGGQGGGGAMVQVFGTDLNESVVRRARIGRYGSEIAADISPERLQRFFIKAENGYQVSRTLREACIFARHNVVREAPFSRLDVICCRNVMIYMEPTLQRRLLPILHYALNASGTLVLGGKVHKPASSSSANRELDRLRRSLAASKQLISTLSDEFQASKQEYQAANEEIASANEELQSTNEELETSKEELQSSNEELNTVNEELRHSNAEQHQLSNDLENLIEAVDIAFVLLDRELRVRRYSPAAERLLRLIPADIGRRIGEIRWTIPATDLDHLALAVLAKAQPQSKAVRDAEGHAYEMRLHPRRSQDGKIDGAVVVLADMQATQKLQQQLDDAEALLNAIIASNSSAAALLDGDANTLYANKEFSRHFGKDADAPWRHTVLDLLKTKPSADFALQRDGRSSAIHAVRVGAKSAQPRILITTAPER